MAIQSVLIPKDKYTRAEAIAYIKKHFKYYKIDSVQRPHFYSFRQAEPIALHTGRLVKGVRPLYTTKVLPNGIELVSQYARLHTVSMAGGSLSFGNIYKMINNGYSIAQDDSILFDDIDDFELIYPPFKKGLNPKQSDAYAMANKKEMQGYKSKSRKQIVINYVGTYKLSDFLNAMYYYLYVYKYTNRFKNAENSFIEFTEILKTKYPNYKITILAHSQSAAISRALLKKYNGFRPDTELGVKGGSPPIFEIINFNPVSHYREHPMKGEYTIHSSIDIPSAYIHKTPKDIKITAESWNPLTEHKTDILLRLNLDTEFGRDL